MVKFIGCKKAAPLAITRVGANPGAHILVTKSHKDAPASEPLENPEMSTTAAADAQKAQAAAVTKILSMNDVTKAHYLALSADDQVTFLEKTADEMNAAAADAKKALDAAAAAAAAAAAGTADTAKSIGDVRAENDVLKARIDDMDLEKRAEREFDGYPGGVDAVLPLLKAYKTLPDAVRTASEAVLKSQCKVALDSGVTKARRIDNGAAASASVAIDEEVTKRRTANPELSTSAAVAAVAKARPDLFMAGLEAETLQAEG